MKKTMGSAAALVAGMAIALTGCGATGGSDGGNGGGGASQAQDVKVGDTVPVKELAQRISGATSEKKTVAVEMNSENEKVTGAVRLGDTPAFTMKGDMESAPMEMVYIDKTLYLSGDGVDQVSGGKKWIKITADGTDMMSKMMGPVIGVFENITDPGKLIGGIDGDAKVKSTSGDETTYEITLTAEQQKKLAEKLDPNKGSSSSSTSAPSASAADQKIELTVDKDNLPVRTRATNSSTPMEVTYSDWGKDVTIEAPPAGEVGTAQMPEMSSGSTGATL